MVVLSLKVQIVGDETLAAFGHSLHMLVSRFGSEGVGRGGPSPLDLQLAHPSWSALPDPVGSGHQMMPGLLAH
jgi:hypothetical protein